MSLVVITDDKAGSSYYLDVTFKETHSYENQITQNPVQDGANINDHVYQQPILFTWDVGMSDCLTSIIPGQFDSSEERSVAAFEVLESLWENAKPLTITTSFRQYKNMLIKSFVPYRDKHTMFGMRAIVIFQQIIVTAATDIAVTAQESADPQTTNKSNTSTKSAAPSAKYKTLTWPASLVVQVKYNGKEMYSSEYFSKYSSSKGTYEKGGFLGLFGNFTITPIIPDSITSASTFYVNDKSYSYTELLNAYGK